MITGFNRGCQLMLVLVLAGQLFAAGQNKPMAKSQLKLQDVPNKIVYESRRTTAGKENWELMLINADGSNPVNLTNTPNIDEMYPHACPMGKRVCFVADEGDDDAKVRNVYYMNIDGSGRAKVADNARQPCWGPKGQTVAYLKGEFDKYTIRDYATKELMYFDIATGKTRQDANAQLHHMYNICCGPAGQWFVATVHGGMGHSHAQLAFAKDGDKVFDLTSFGVTGCRPDLDFARKRITWGATDWDLCVADFDIKDGEPVVTNVRKIIHCEKTHEVYHTDFSSDAEFIAFSYGPKAQEMVGGIAPGWNICVSDLDGNWVQITDDGNHNKEPDWVPVAK